MNEPVGMERDSPYSFLFVTVRSWLDASSGSCDVGLTTLHDAWLVNGGSEAGFDASVVGKKVGTVDDGDRGSKESA